MQRILSLKKKAGYINLSFVNSNVCIAIPLKKNLFEIKIFSTLIDPDAIAEYYYLLKLLTGIVNDLNLNTRIWTKE